nr:hypothetical protein [uncultured Ruminococcus sp.]
MKQVISDYLRSGSYKVFYSDTYSAQAGGQDHIGSICGDVRSLAYYAMGKAKNGNNRVAVVCLTTDLFDMLPAVTEAYYQQLDLLLIASGKPEMNKRIAECYRVVTDSILLSRNDSDAFFCSATPAKGISLVFDELSALNETEIRKVAVQALISEYTGKSKARVLCDPRFSADAGSVEYLRDGCSLYEILGRAYASDDIICAVLSAKSIITGINAVNIRYKKDNLFIVCPDGSLSQYRDWFNGNGFRFISDDKADNQSVNAMTLPAILCTEAAYV